MSTPAVILVQPDAGIQPVKPTFPLTEKTGQRILAALGGSPTSATPSVPKFAVINASTSGDNSLVAAVTGKKIRVLAYVLMAAGAVNARFQTGTAGAGLSGLFPLTAQAGAASGYAPVGHFETGAGDLLNLELSGAVAVTGHLVYVEV